MPRLPVIDPANPTVTSTKAIFDGPLKGKHINIFKGLANSHAALEAYVSFSGALAHGLFSAQERELIALAVGEANNCGYCVAAHTVIGKGAGLNEQQTLDARRGSPTDAKHKALTTFVLALHAKRGLVSDSDLAAFKAAGYTDGHVAESVANYALNIFTNYFNHTNDTTIDFPIPAKV
jgi:AhpD family alkylhydroperoxidase